MVRNLSSYLPSLVNLEELQFSTADFYSVFLYADVEPWTFEQHLGEAVFIPAGCPHQVRNRQVMYPIKLSVICCFASRLQ